MDDKAHHLEIDAEQMTGNGGLGRYCFLPGSVERAQRLARRFTDAREHVNRRGMNVQLGVLERDGQRVEVAAVPTGMGCPSVDIIVGELLRLGARRFLRIGTAGTLQPGIRNGHLVVASGAVRDEGASDAYAPREFPAVADPVMVETLCATARRMDIGGLTHCGLVHSKDAFFGREFTSGPAAEANEAYMEHLRRCGVLASEMEAAHLFILGATSGVGPTSVEASRTDTASVRCGAVMAVVGDSSGFADLDDEQNAEERLIDLAVESVLDLAAMELSS